jgi:anti-anti-sigma factor
VTTFRVTNNPLEGVIAGIRVRPRGHVRGPTAEEFRQYVNGILDEGLTTWLVIDFAKVNSIDSSTAGYLLNLHDRMGELGGALALARLTPTVRVVIESIGLMSFFTVTETIEDAILEFGSP